MRGALPTIRIPRRSQGRRKDGRHGDRFSYQDEREFQRADRGYHRSFGDRERYRQIFRDGYAAGYSDAFGRYARVPRNDGWSRPTPGVRGPYGQQGPYPSRGVYGPAASIAVVVTAWPSTTARETDTRRALEDARKNRSLDPLRHSWYARAIVTTTMTTAPNSSIRTRIARGSSSDANRDSVGRYIVACL